MVRIYIENQELDVMQDFSHQITYAIDDIRNIDSKATTFTKTIVLPGTANNNALLGNIFEMTNANFTIDDAPNVGYNFNAAKSAQARIEINGLQVMKGVMRLMEIIIDGNNIEYEIALFGELGGFINAVGSKKLVGNEIVSDDLDFSEYNHEYSIGNIEASWNRDNNYYALTGIFSASSNSIGLRALYLTNINIGDTFVISNTTLNNGTFSVVNLSYFQVNGEWYTVIKVNEAINNEFVIFPYIDLPNFIGKGYVYPLIDYGNVSPAIPSVSIAKHDYQYKAFRPAFFVREIIEKIISDAGYSFESKFFNTQFFNRLIIPNNDKGLLKRDVFNYIISDCSGQTHSGSTAQTQTVSFTNTTLTSFTYGAGIYTYSGADATSTKVTLSVSGIAQLTPFCTATIYINTSQGNIGSFQIVARDTPTPFNATISGSHTFNPGEIIRVQIVIAGNPRAGFNVSITDFAASLSVVQDPATSIPYELGDTILLSNLLPKNIFQKDFFIAILKMFNLYVVEDKYTEKKLIIEPYVDYYQTGNYLDWTEKVDRSQPIRVKPMSELSSRYYEFKYKSDSDFYNEKYRNAYFEGYGDRLYDNLFEFTTEKQSNEVLFSATPLVGYVDRDKVVSTIFKMNNEVEEATEHNIRIMQFNLITDVSSWKIQNQTITLGTYTNYPYAGHLDNPDLPAVDLNFGATKELYFTLLAGALSNNIFNAYYSPYMAEITDKDSRLVTARMKFNELDIFNLDFSRLIYIDNVVYRLSKIIDYSLSELCNVELLRVINTTYYDVDEYDLYLKIDTSIYYVTQHTEFTIGVYDTDLQYDYYVDCGDGTILQGTITGDFYFLRNYEYNTGIYEIKVRFTNKTNIRIFQMEYSQQYKRVSILNLGFTSINAFTFSGYGIDNADINSFDVIRFTNLTYFLFAYCKLTQYAMANILKQFVYNGKLNGTINFSGNNPNLDIYNSEISENFNTLIERGWTINY